MCLLAVQLTCVDGPLLEKTCVLLQVPAMTGCMLPGNCEHGLILQNTNAAVMRRWVCPLKWAPVFSVALLCVLITWPRLRCCPTEPLHRDRCINKRTKTCVCPNNSTSSALRWRTSRCSATNTNQALCCKRESTSHLVDPLQTRDGVGVDHHHQPWPHPHPCHRHGQL